MKKIGRIIDEAREVLKNSYVEPEDIAIAQEMEDLDVLWECRNMAIEDLNEGPDSITAAGLVDIDRALESLRD